MPDSQPTKREEEAMTQEGQSTRKKEVVRVSSGRRIAIPRDMASLVKIKEGDYIKVWVEHGMVFIQRLDLELGLSH